MISKLLTIEVGRKRHVITDTLGLVWGVVVGAANEADGVVANRVVEPLYGKYSKRYHYTPNCTGLNNCSTDIYKISLKKAKEIGRTLCKKEY